jgi:hypothetical protein
MWKIAKTKESLKRRGGVIVAIALCIGVTAPGVATATGTPLRPTNFSGSCTDAYDSWGQFSLTFTPGLDGGSPITNYEYRNNDGAWLPFNPPTTTQPFVFNFTTLNFSPMTVSIELRAVNANGAGESSWNTATTPASGQKIACTLSGNGRPLAPVTATATAGNGSASIDFTRGSTVGFQLRTINTPSMEE